MIRRISTLILFELNKILNRKKALLFLFALNVIPLIASIGLIVAYIKYKSLGFGGLQYSMLYEAVRNLFTLHFKLFAFIAPFFLSLIVGDSFSTEFGRGHMKMLLLTPVKRWQVITAKTIAIMFFLIIAVAIGGIMIQSDLLIAKAITQKTSVDLILGTVGMEEAKQNTVAVVNFSSATQLLILSFIGNLTATGYFIIFSLFFESAILMSFASISVLMVIHSFYYIADAVFSKFDPWYGKIAEWCFTRHSDNLFSFENISGILDGTKTIFTEEIMQSCISTMGWTAFFFGLAVFVFSKKQILH